MAERAVNRAVWQALSALLILLVLGQPAVALDPRLRISQYQVQCYGVAHGLPQGSVSAIVQHPSGYLLLATNRGLVRFDGARISYLEIDGAAVLPDSQIHRLLVTPDGTLWVGTFKGLYRIDERGVQRIGEAEGLPQDRVIAVRVESEQLWVGTQGGAVRFDQQQGEWQLAATLGPMRVNAFDRDPDGTLWLAAAEGVFRQRPGEEVEQLVPESKVGAEMFWSTLLDRQGRRWIGGRLRLLLRANGSDALEEVPETLGMPGLPVRQIFEDRDGQLWFANAGAGLYRMREGALERLPGLASDVVYALAEDNEGNLWAGTSNGVCRVRDGAILGYGFAEGLGTDFILTVAADAQGRAYIGSNGRGLYRIDAGGVQWLGNPGDDGFVNRVDVWPDGRVFVSSNVGSYFVDEQGFQPVAPELTERWLSWLAQDGEGAYWFRGGGVGLGRLQQGQLRRYDLDGDPARWGFAGRDGQIWLTGGGGLYRTAGAELERVAELGDRAIAACQYEDPEGIVWCTGRGGLLRVEGAAVSYLGEEAFEANAVLALQPGTDGALWVATTAGLYRADLDELNAAARGDGGAPEFRRFDERHGMRSSEFSRAYSPGIGAVSGTGELWWATMSGAIVVDPARLARAVPAPPVQIEALRLDGQSIPVAAWSQLGPDIGRLEIRYTALSLTDAASLQFRHRLQPGSPQWTVTGDREIASYGLPAGRYRFEVQATYDRSRWPDEISQIEFTVLPRWYQNWLVRAGLALVALVLLISLPLLRIAALRHRAAMLQAEVAARTEELSAANARLDQIARTDALTGIGNRRDFDQRLPERLRSQASLALLLIDVDAFKAYNDRFGHPAGDACLQQVAAALDASLPDPRVLLARYGGEEFIALVEDAGAIGVAERLLEAVRALNLEHPESPSGRVSISIGVAQRRQLAESAEALLQRADQALYQAKNAGRDQARAG